MVWLSICQIVLFIIVWRISQGYLVKLLLIQFLLGFILYNLIVDDVFPYGIEFLYLILIGLGSRLNLSLRLANVPLGKNVWKLILYLSIIFLLIGISLNSYSVGLNETTLPFRLAGLVEFFGSYLIYEALLKVCRINMMKLLLPVLSLLFLFTSGSKFYALVPIIYGFFGVFSKREKFVIPFIILFGLLFFNPFKIREIKQDNDQLNIGDLITIEGVSMERIVPLMRYIAGRFCGKEVVIWLDEEDVKYESGSVQEYMNHATFAKADVSYAAGFFGFIYLKSKYNYILFSILVFFFILLLRLIECWFDSFFSPGLVTILMFPILVDGPMSESNIFKVLFLFLISVILISIHGEKSSNI